MCRSKFQKDLLKKGSPIPCKDTHSVLLVMYGIIFSASVSGKRLGLGTPPLIDCGHITHFKLHSEDVSISMIFGGDALYPLIFRSKK
jgi:hypothetical protein